MLVLVVGLNPAAAPVGSPVVPKVTVEAKPPVIVRVTAEAALAPAATLIVDGDADSVKFLIVNAIELVCVRLPLVPVTVSV